MSAAFCSSNDEIEISFYNRQRGVPLNARHLAAFAQKAVKPCLEHPGSGNAVLAGLSEVEISLVSDSVIARLHQQFMAVPGATDVITFEHGELIISAATAARQALVHAETLEREIARYIMHGLLHLNGHEDDHPEVAARMWRAQESLLADLWTEDRVRR